MAAKGLTFKEAYCSIQELVTAMGATRYELSTGPVGRFKSGRERYELKLFGVNSIPLGNFDAMKLQSKFTDGDRWMVSKYARSWDCPRKGSAGLEDVYDNA